jgi:hypothetical protein
LNALNGHIWQVLPGRRVVCYFVIAQKFFSMHVGAMSRAHGGCVAMHILFGVSQAISLQNHNILQNSYYNGPRTLLGSKAECSSNYKHTRVCKSETNTLKLRTCGWLIIDNYLSMARSNTVHNNCCDINSTHTIASVKATGHCHTSN